MKFVFARSVLKSDQTLLLTGSKSESNRLLVLQALYPQIKLENLSASDDTQIMRNALQSRDEVIHVGHAGTAMRFLTAYLATQNKNVTLTGSARMCERPIKILVDALRTLGADINYAQKEGFPPLIIKPARLFSRPITLDADVSSQYISALLLIAPKLENGLTLRLNGEITSESYLNMTIEMLRQLGIPTTFEQNVITVNPIKEIPSAKYTVESDWSSASYIYSAIALSKIGTSVKLASFRENSVQGDNVLREIYEDFGVQTKFEHNQIVLEKVAKAKKKVNYNLKNTPDLAQTIAVTCAGLHLACMLKGLATLKIKETDRLFALKSELSKLGVNVAITSDTLAFSAPEFLKPDTEIETYDDHRMAMAFAPLALKIPISIKNPDVVSKSYPQFWADFAHLGFEFAAQKI